MHWLQSLEEPCRWRARGVSRCRRVIAEQEKKDPGKVGGHPPPPAAGLQGPFHFEGLGRHERPVPFPWHRPWAGVEAEREEMVTVKVESCLHQDLSARA